MGPRYIEMLWKPSLQNTSGGSWATRMTESDHQNKQSRGALKWDVLEVSVLAAVHSSTVVWGDCGEVGEGDFASLGRGRGPPTDNLCGWAWWLEDYASSFQNHFHHLPLANIEARINFQDFRFGQMLPLSSRVRQTPLLLQTAALSRLLLGRQNFNLIFDRNFSSIFFILIYMRERYVMPSHEHRCICLPRCQLGQVAMASCFDFAPTVLSCSTSHAFMLALLLSFCLLMLWEISCRAFQLATVRSARYFLISLRTKQVLCS